MTYDEIKTQAFNFFKNKGEDKGAADIVSMIELGNESFFNQFDAEKKAHFIDNLILDYFCYGVVEGIWAYDLSDTAKVYEAAKIIFARHPEKSFTRDAESAYSIFGSPWACECKTPEDWAIEFAALGMQNDEASISGPITKELIDQAVELVQGLIHLDISRDKIEQGLSSLSWGRYPLRNAVAVKFGFEEYKPTPEEIADEAEWLEETTV